jgi:uncharacterized membrane protein YbhN (UPF0104 family)
MRASPARMARWAVGIALLGGLLAWFDPGSVAARLGAVDMGRALPAILGLVGIHLVAAAAWRRLTDRLVGIRLDWRATIRAYYAAQALGVVTPANLGADLYRVAAIDGGGSRSRVAGPVVIQRLTSIGALLILGFLGAVALPIAGLRSFAVGALALGIGGAAITVVAVARSAKLPGPVRRLVGRLGLEPPLGSTRTWLSSILRDGLGLGLVFHGVSLLLGLVLVAAVDGGSLNRPGDILAALAVARLSLAVPLSPNGIGVQEGALAILFSQLGLPPAVALAAALLNRVALIATAALGTVALVSAPRPAVLPTTARRASRPLDG